MKFNEIPYKRLDMEQVKEEFHKVLEAFKAAKSAEEQYEIHKKKSDLFDRIETTYTIAYIRSDIDTADPFYKAEKEFYDEVLPLIEQMANEYNKALYASEYRDYLEEKIGAVAFKNIEIGLKAFDDSIIPLMQEENSLVTKYDNLIAGAKVEWEGEILNLSLLAKYRVDPDRSVRERAYAKQCAFYEENGAKIDEIYDQLVKNRTEQAKKLGYKNFVELGYYRMQRNCYDKDMVENFRSQVKKYLVPFAEKLHEKRRKRLGLDGLSYIDEGVYFTKGNPTPIGDPDYIVAEAKKMYSELSAETKEYFDFMTENQLFDLLGRKNKKAGGYMTYLPVYKSPFIFANFNGTADDVGVVTHECGHAFQGYLSANDPIVEHREITMETAEIHSMSMEFFTDPWMKFFFGDRTDDFYTLQLEEAIEFVPYGCMVDEFQHIVYANPELTSEERHSAWKKLEEEYRPHIDYSANAYLAKGTFWQKQSHIFDVPFYYIDYCIAEICAFQYKVKMDEDYKAAWESYLRLCKMGAADFFTTMIKEVGLENPFEDGCIEHLVEKLEKKASK